MGCAWRSGGEVITRPDDPFAGDVADVGAAGERQHVMLAQADERDVADDDHLVVAVPLERREQARDVDVVPGGHLDQRAGGAARGRQHPFVQRVVPQRRVENPRVERRQGRFQLAPARIIPRLVEAQENRSWRVLGAFRRHVPAPRRGRGAAEAHGRDAATCRTRPVRTASGTGRGSPGSAPRPGSACRRSAMSATRGSRR